MRNQGKQVAPLLLIVLIASSGFAGVAWGASKTGTVKPATAAKQPTVPAGMVTQAEALRRVQTHKAALAERWTEMVQQYDKQAKLTLGQEFKRQNTAQQAYQYLSAWSDNDLYLTWYNKAQRFYNYHSDALKASERAVGLAPYTRSADLAYLDKGMALWKVKEKIVSSLMKDYLYHTGKRGYYSGEALKITSDACYYSINCPGFQSKWMPHVENFRRMADNAIQVQKETQVKLLAAAQEKLFSALSEPSRIAISEQCQEIFISNKNVPAVVDYGTGETSTARSPQASSQCSEIFVQNKKVPPAVQYSE